MELIEIILLSCAFLSFETFIFCKEEYEVKVFKSITVGKSGYVLVNEYFQIIVGVYKTPFDLHEQRPSVL